MQSVQGALPEIFFLVDCFSRSIRAYFEAREKNEIFRSMGLCRALHGRAIAVCASFAVIKTPWPNSTWREEGLFHPTQPGSNLSLREVWAETQAGEKPGGRN